MSDAPSATFTVEDWQNLEPHDKHIIRAIGRAAVGFEALSKIVGVGIVKVQSLIDKGLAEEGRSTPRGEQGYRLTEKGWFRSSGAKATR